jgi:hypothetical protein
VIGPRLWVLGSGAGRTAGAVETLPVRVLEPALRRRVRTGPADAGQDGRAMAGPPEARLYSDETSLARELQRIVLAGAADGHRSK